MEQPPTEKQLAYIRLLAKRLGASLYLGNIRSVEEASRMIDSLKQQWDARQAPGTVDQPR